MRKQLFSILLVVGMASVMTGCASKVDLTEQQSELVADYLSSVILRYDQNDNGNKLVKLESIDVATPAPVQTDAPSDTMEDNQTVEIKNTPTPSKDNASDLQVSGQVANSEKVTLESLYGLNNVSLTYKSVKEYKAYPKSDVAGAVTAGANKKFYAVTFTLKNKSDKNVTVNLLKKKANFLLKTEDGNWISAVHTLLDDDMTYYVGDIKANKSKDVVVLFEVKESLKISNATFYALTDSMKAYEVAIKE
ncbi:MAG: hypothetical protein Q4F05_18555 [bacterium]|nr:hypothetical protein [bacterium]